MLQQEKLIALRRYMGITQREMAELIGVDIRTYINKESGVTQFKANEMFAISERLNAKIDQIFLPSNFMNHEVGSGDATIA